MKNCTYMCVQLVELATRLLTYHCVHCLCTSIQSSQILHGWVYYVLCGSTGLLYFVYAYDFCNHTDNETERTSSINASIFHNGSEVFVTCELPADYPEASCVLVYREYGNTTLGVRVYNGNTTFPITITGENYTFAVFGRRSDSHIDRIPVTSERIVFNGTGMANVIFEANRLPETLSPSPLPSPVTSPLPPGEYIGSYCVCYLHLFMNLQMTQHHHHHHQQQQSL